MRKVLFCTFLTLIAACATAAPPEGQTWVARETGSHMMGLKVPQNLSLAMPVEAIPEPGVAMPKNFDWRTIGKLSPIRDQGNCGSCWSFSLTASMEDALSLAHIPQSLSQQYLVSCNTLGYGCNGGWFDAADMLVNPGSVSADQFAYTATDSACKSGLKYGEKINSWAFVKTDSEVPSNDLIKKAIYQYGPLSVGVYASSAMQAYGSGIFNTCSSGGSINHAVNIVGWNDDGGYWIMRNSWGESWGEQGYIRIKYGCNKIGYAATFYNFRIPPNTNPPSELPTCVLTATPASIKVGESSTLMVSGSNGAVTATIESQTVPVSGGSIVVTPTSSAVYTATVKGDKGEGTCQAKVDVNVPCSPDTVAEAGPDVTVSRRENYQVSTTVVDGQTYCWKSESTVSTWCDPVWNFKTNKRGVYVYDLTVTGKCGIATDKMTITVK